MCPFGVTHRAMKLLFQVAASPAGQLSSTGVGGEVRNFLLAHGLMKTFKQYIEICGPWPWLGSWLLLAVFALAPERSRWPSPLFLVFLKPALLPCSGCQTSCGKGVPKQHI